MTAEDIQAGEARPTGDQRSVLQPHLTPYPTVEWLTFDIIGTVFDVVGSLTASMRPIAESIHVNLKYGDFAYNWLEGYGGGIGAVGSGQHPWEEPDAVIKDAFLQEWHAAGQSAIDGRNTDRFCNLWRELHAWPDAMPGFKRLRKRFKLSTLSNSGIDQQRALMKFSGLPFDNLLSGATVKAYKPNPAVYKMALSTLNLKPHQVMMVAAHKYDVAAAKALGFHTAFISRPLELGPDHHPDSSPDPSVDVNANGMEDLAAKLGL